MSKKQERLRSELLSEDKIIFDIIKLRRIEHLQNQEPFSSDPYFRGCNGQQNHNCNHRCQGRRGRQNSDLDLPEPVQVKSNQILTIRDHKKFF